MTQKTEGYAVTDMKDGVVEKFTYEGAEFARKDGEASVGDYVVFAESEDNFILVDKPYEIESIDCADDPQVIDEDGDNFDTAGEDFAVFTKVAEPAEEPSQETEVQREAKVGDRIKIVAAEWTDGVYKNGDIGVVITPGSYGITADINGKRKGIFNREYVVLESAETLVHEGVTYQRVNRRAQAGDVVVFAEDDHPEWLIIGGKPYRCVNTLEERPRFTAEDYGDFNVYHPSEGRDESNVKVYEPIAKDVAIAKSTLTYRDSSGAIQTVIGAELIEYRAKGDE